MKDYDVIATVTGSAMNFMENILQMDSDAKVAVIDKDDPGGICLTRGCIPTELLRSLEGARSVSIEADIKRIDFQGIMNRMASKIKKETIDAA